MEYLPLQSRFWDRQALKGLGLSGAFLGVSWVLDEVPGHALAF